MKKLFLILLCVAVFTGLAVAQNYTLGTSTITGGTIDKLGAHNNGGRGCTGCHAPHSGGYGAGGNAGTGGTTDNYMGNDALWGQDMGPLYNQTLKFGDNGTYQMTLPQMSDFAVGNEDIRGVMMCLSCHDGNIAKGGMMQNKSWEKENGLLPTGIYGPNPIPTLLGNDGTTAGNYNNDHPVGPMAKLSAVRVDGNFQVSTCGSGASAYSCLTVKTSGADAYNLFVYHYGAPALVSNGHASPVVIPDGTVGNAYVVCTTCHTPHSMYTYNASSASPIATRTSGTFPTYFFIAAPYNPGSNPGKNEASSATQFCRQCHFTGAGGSNEGSSINNVTTAF